MLYFVYMTKEDALKKIDELRKFVERQDKVVIKSIGGVNMYTSDCTTGRDAVMEAMKKGVDLCYADLSGYDLSKILFWKKELNGVKFNKCNLEKSVFTECSLYGAKFTNANLKKTSFAYCDLQNSDFYGADLCDANFSGSFFNGDHGFLLYGAIEESQACNFLRALGYNVV